MKTVLTDAYQLIASINIGTKKYPNELLAEGNNTVICQGARKMVLHKDNHVSKPAFKLHNEQEELLLAKVKIGDLDQSFSYTSPQLEDVYKLVVGKEIAIGNEKYKVELCPHETAPQLLLQSEGQFEQPLCFGMEGIMGEADYLYQFVIYEEEGKKKLDCRFGNNSWSINAYEYMVFVLRKV